LGDDKVGAGLLLLEEELDVGELVGRVGVALRVACRSGGTTSVSCRFD